MTDMQGMRVEFNDEKYFDDETVKSKSSTVACECGERCLEVNFIPAPWTGCYLKVTCPKCNTSSVLFNSFS